jgi:hypothetical protein
MTTNDKVLVPREVLELYQFMTSAGSPFTPHLHQIAISLRKAKAAMHVAAALPAEDGLPELPEAAVMTQLGRDAYTADQMLAFRAEGIAYVQQRGAAVVVDDDAVDRAIDAWDDVFGGDNKRAAMKVAITAALKLQESAASQSQRTSGPRQDALDWLQARAEEGCVTMRFELDGGVHVTLEPVGDPERAARNANSVREGIASLMAEPVVDR